jgi:hypothetical protein
LIVTVRIKPGDNVPTVGDTVSQPRGPLVICAPTATCVPFGPLIVTFMDWKLVLPGITVKTGAWL